MKVLQIHNFYKTPGGECSVVRAEHQLLIKHGNTVDQFICDSSTIEHSGLWEKIRLFIGIPYNRQIYKQMMMAIKTNKPDVAHVHNVFPMMSPSIYVALRRSGIPVVQTLHNYRFLCPNGQFFVEGKVCEDCQKKGFIAAVRKACVRGSYITSMMYAFAVFHTWKSGVLPDAIDKFIALNNFVADKMFAGGVPREKISICGNYIESTALSVADKRGYILYLGRLSAEKGVETLIESMSLLGDVTLKVAGSGPDEEVLKNKALELNGGQVDFLGHINGAEKQKIVAEALCMVVPSEWYENFPISVVESMSLGTPVVASKMGGLPDMIEHGVNGMLFEAGNHIDLANCLRLIVENKELASMMAEQSINTAISKFGAEEHYQQLMVIYRDAIAGI